LSAKVAGKCSAVDTLQANMNEKFTVRNYFFACKIVFNPFFQFSCRQELRLQQMSKSFQIKKEYKKTRKVTFERRNRELSELLETIHQKKIENTYQPIIVWREN
jgi:hypothetical protein